MAEFAVFLGRFAGEDMEGADKVAIVVKAAEGCRFGNRLALIQKVLCVTDANEDGVLFDRNANAFLKVGNQLGTADEEIISKHIDGDIFGIMGADVFDHLADITFGHRLGKALFFGVIGDRKEEQCGFEECLLFLFVAEILTEFIKLFEYRACKFAL